MSDEGPWSTASIRITSTETTPDAITARLGLSPSAVGQRGLPVSSRTPDGPGHAVNSWIYNSPLSDAEPLESHVRALLRAFEPVRAQLAELPDDCQIDVVLGLTAHASGRVHDLDAATVKGIAALNAFVSIDLYGAD